MRLVLSAWFGFGASLVALAPVPAAAAVAADHVVISEVYGGGGNAGSYFQRDFVELYNPTAAPVSLAGWSVQYASSLGTSWQVTSLPVVTIAPHGYFLVQEAQGSGGFAGLPSPDALGTIMMGGTTGKVAVCNSTTALVGSAPTGASIVDFVGYGSANGYEGTGPTAVLSNSTSARRVPVDIDTDDNAADFDAGIVAPNSSTSSAMAPGAPSTTIRVVPAGWTTSTVEFSIEATYPGQNITGIYYKIDDGPEYAFTTSQTITAEGDHSIAYWATNDGTLIDATKTAQARIDRTAPVIPDDHLDLYQGLETANVRLSSAVETASGFDYAQYRIGEGEWTPTSLPATITLPAAGTYSVALRAADLAGNVSERSFTTVVEERAPELSITGVPVGWVDAPAVEFTVDGTSTTAELTVGYDARGPVRHDFSVIYDLYATHLSVSGTLTDEGTTTIEYYALDHFGQAATATAVARIDRTPPTSTVSVTQGRLVSRAVITAADAFSGVAKTEWRETGGVVHQGTAISVAGTGVHKVEYASTDNVGRKEATKSVDITVLPATTEPVEGPTRFDTAIAAVKAAFPDGADTVVIAYGRNFPDALGGSALCGAYGSPLLLVEQDSVPAAVRDEIVRLKAKRAIVIGATSVVSKGVADQLGTLVGGASNVERVAGADRYDTAAKVAAAVAAKAGAREDVFLAVGDNFPDALAASPAAYAKRWPILLTRRDALPSQTLAQLSQLEPKRVHILGSTGAVPLAVENQLKAALPGTAVDRWQGPGRYETAVDIATKSGLSFNSVALATGENFPDALAGGVMQGKLGGVVLLTPKTSLNPATAAAIKARPEVGTVRFLGSASAISSAVRTAVAALLK